MPDRDSRIDDYLAALPTEQREALEHVRGRIHELVPDAIETISYGMPAFTLHSRALIWFAGWKSHLSLYPLTDAFLAGHADELATFGRTKGSVHFTPAKPLPEPLFRELVLERKADVERDNPQPPR
jgi:uncharacterized protein YdhG (YjbR/CyaY superfamily)